jgi:hypothetical protein
VVEKEDHSSRPAWAKVRKTLSRIKNKPGMATHICNLGYSRGGDRRATIQDWPREKLNTLSKKQTKAKENAYQEQGPEVSTTKQNAITYLLVSLSVQN